MRTDEENRLAALTKAKPLPQNRFALNHRHASSQAGDWTTAVLSWQVGTSSVWFTCRWLPNTGTLPLERPGSPCISRLEDKILCSAKLVDDRTDDCAFGAMMLLAYGNSSENCVFR
jgi:hypothetical protein